MVGAIVGLSDSNHAEHAAGALVSAVAEGTVTIVEILPSTDGVHIAGDGGLEEQSRSVISDQEVPTTHLF